MASAYVEKRRGARGMRYRAVLEWQTPAGPKRHKDPWTRYWRSAQRKKEELLRDAEDIRLGLKKPAPARSWADLAQEYKTYSQKDKQPATWKNWDRPALELFGEFLGDPCTPVASIDSERMGAFRRFLEDRGLAPNTVAGYGRHLCAAFSYAVRPLRWISESPCAGVVWPAYEPTGEPIDDADITSILEHAPERLRAVVWVGRQTGARVGEIVNLDHRQLDRAAGMMRVMVHRRRGRRASWRPKTEPSRRQIPVAPEVWPLFGPAQAEGPVFPGYKGTPEERVNQVSKDFRVAREAAIEAAKAAGDTRRAERLAEATFHDLKHTFCTVYLERGGSTAKLSEITGTSEATLKKTYAHLVGRITVADMSFAAHPKFHPKSEAAGPDEEPAA